MIDKKKLLEKYGYNTISYQSLAQWFQTYWDEKIEGYISYIKVDRKNYIVVWDPICSENDMMTLIHNFRRKITEQRWKILFLSVSIKCKNILDVMWFWSLKIGEEWIFDATNFSLEGKERKDFRNLIKRAQKEWVTIRTITNITQQEVQWIEELNLDWLTTRKTKGFSFLLQLSPLENLSDKILFIAELKWQIVWYISAVPIYQRKWFYFEDIIRSTKAPLGTNQFLVYSALSYLKENGYTMASIWTSPLWNIDDADNKLHKKTQRILSFLYKYGHSFYNFKWLYHFKKSLAPNAWESKYISFYPPKLSPNVFFSIARAYNPRGITGIVFSKVIKLFLWKKIFIPKKKKKS
jgi:phosphatidylglycerol lysyltransferase